MKNHYKSANTTDTRDLARAIRLDVLRMVHKARASHVGSCFSMADMLAVLYGKAMRVRPNEPGWTERDRLVVSKGHAAAAVYAALANSGYFSRELLEDYCVNGSLLTGHISHAVPGIEVSTGSLGHGLPIGLGMAMAARVDNSSTRAFVIMSDGECDEGSIWEAALFAGHHGVDNLTVLIDYNKIQSFGRVSDVLELEPFADKWKAFRWDVQEVDGHDHKALGDLLLSLPTKKGSPTVILCHTIKGKGVSFMEDKLEWHYRSPSDEQLAQAIAEVGEQ